MDTELRETLLGSRFNQIGRVELSDGLKAGELYSLTVKFTKATGSNPAENEEIVLDKDYRLSN